MTEPAPSVVDQRALDQPETALRAAAYLENPNDAMADTPQTVSRDKVGEAIGRLPDVTMLRVNRALALFLGFA